MRRSQGSSPLTRGKHAADGLLTVGDGLIPAHAGKTVPAGHAVQTTEAHPRSRGENGGLALRARGVGGSSPLTRGKRVRDEGRARRRGLIPAHAGKTTGGCLVTPATRAHPRSRGENACARLRRFGLAGSSPLTRGKPSLILRVRSSRGLIPAHAGKTG